MRAQTTMDDMQLTALVLAARFLPINDVAMLSCVSRAMHARLLGNTTDDGWWRERYHDDYLVHPPTLCKRQVNKMIETLIASSPVEYGPLRVARRRHWQASSGRRVIQHPAAPRGPTTWRMLYRLWSQYIVWPTFRIRIVAQLGGGGGGAARFVRVTSGALSIWRRLDHWRDTYRASLPATLATDYAGTLARCEPIVVEKVLASACFEGCHYRALFPGDHHPDLRIWHVLPRLAVILARTPPWCYTPLGIWIIDRLADFPLDDVLIRGETLCLATILHT